MKKMIFLGWFFLVGAAFAQKVPTVDILKDTHWTLKKILCSSGLPATPGFTQGTRYDVHFLAENIFETLITSNNSWTVVKGKYTTAEAQLCLTEKFLMTSGAPPYYYDRENCFIHTVYDKQLTWQFQNGDDCPASNHQIMIFEKQ